MNNRRRAITVSIVVHVILLGVLFVWYLPDPSAESGTSAGTVGSDPAGGDTTESSSESRGNPPAVPESIRDIADQQRDVAPEEIDSSIKSQIEAAEKLPDDRKLTELEKNLKRLESLASEQSVDQLTSTVAESLGLDTDQYAPKEVPDEGAFDINSAQLSDVVRTQDDQGEWSYETVVVDAGGREQRVPIDAAEGERLYETFELLKRHPMAHGVYQSVVMPMMQKMLEAKSTNHNNAPTVIMPESG